MKTKKRILFWVALATISLWTFWLPMQAGADLHNWSQGTTGNWNTAANWGGTLPTSNDTATLDVGSNKVSYIVTFDDISTNPSLSVLNVSGKNSGQTSTLQIQSGTLGATTINLGGYGFITLSGGTLTAPNVALSGGTFTKSGGTLKVGTLFNQTGGTSSFDTLSIDNGTSYVKAYTLGAGSGTLTATDVALTGGAFTKSGGTLKVTNLFNQTGGASNFDTLSIDGGTSYVKAYTLSGGTLTAPNIALSGGTFTQSAGILKVGTLFNQSGGTSTFDTLTVDGTGTANNTVKAYTLSNGTATIGTLSYNGGALTLSGGTLTVTNDYTNSNWGSRNTFNPLAGISGSGAINASNAGQQITGGASIANGTASGTLALGNVRVGLATTSNYQIRNSGTGASIRGAIQTTGSGLINDLRLSGTGVTATDFGPITAGSSSSDFAVTFTASSSGAQSLTGQKVFIYNNFGNVTDQTLNITVGNAYNPAVANTIANPSKLANQRVGGSATRALSVTNTAASGSFTEGLDATFGTPTGSATSSGSISLLAGGLTDNTHLLVGVNTATAGAKTGTAVVNLYSNGSGTSGLTTLTLAPQTVTVSGDVYRHAAPVLNTTTLDLGTVRVGDSSPSKYISITNNATNDGYSEGLKASFGSARTGFSTTGTISNLTAGGINENTLQVSLGTSTAGSFGGSQALNLWSTGSGTSGLDDLSLTGKNVTLSGKVYQPAVASFSSAAIDFGTVHKGETVAAKSLTVTNTATSAALNDVLTGTFSGGSSPLTASGTLGTGLTPGANSNTSLQAQLNTGTAGIFTGTASLSLASHNADMTDLSLGSTSITLKGTVNNWANPVFTGTGISGSGNAFTLNLGTFTQGSSVSASLGLKNDAPTSTPSDWLRGSYTLSGNTAYTLSGFDAFSGLLAGTSQTGLSVGLSTANAGDFIYSIVLNGFSGNNSGTSALPDVTLNLSATVTAAPVPLPSAVWLLGAGLLGLVGIRRRFSN